ncbi:MAG: alpha-glucan family phosphorylase [Gemmatimonadaceae bacterium]
MPNELPELPPRISGLVDVANNVSWSWNREARALFRLVDPQLWIRYRHDPLKMLRKASDARIAQCAADPVFLALYDGVMRWHAAERSSDLTWFAREFPALRDKPIAYFCAEFALHHSVPIYSGGLGVLAGDHCKQASDLGVPLVGVGILYRAGYFDQRIRADGWQEDADARFDINETALEPIPGPGGQSWITTVRTDGRDVRIKAWRLRVGRMSTYLLDTDIPENHDDDRPLLSKLYAGGPELRLKQEWLLGVGGVRMLRALGIAPAAWHANEGHAAFMFVERLRELVAAGTPYAQAVEQVRANSTFTTHTPVPAGHDTFPFDRVIRCAGPIWEELGIDRAGFERLGRHPVANDAAFHMTIAAMRLARHCNAVSRTHAVVTRQLWAPLWPDRREEAVPVTHITNGVHLATWMSNSVMEMLERHLGADWDARLIDPSIWNRVLDLDDAVLWRVHGELKAALVGYVREQARYTFSHRNRAADQMVGAGILLDPDVLTIGFARRFATYKQANLIFHDVERLLRIVTDPERPVQIVFAGKAHPADNPGKQVLQEVFHASRDPRFQGRVAFIEDYDMHLAHMLVQGVDLWMNLPRPPMEAAGTSGMKAALNGVPQLSTMDGWWAEGFDGANGWSLAAPSPEVEQSETREGLAHALYALLEGDVVPDYYERNAEGIPLRWLHMMKHSLRAAGAHFTARRMLMEYVRKFYIPSIQGHEPPDEPPTA